MHFACTVVPRHPLYKEARHRRVVNIFSRGFIILTVAKRQDQSMFIVIRPRDCSSCVTTRIGKRLPIHCFPSTPGIVSSSLHRSVNIAMRSRGDLLSWLSQKDKISQCSLPYVLVVARDCITVSELIEDTMAGICKGCQRILGQLMWEWMSE